MAAITKENLRTMIIMERANFVGVISRHMRGTGFITRCMVRELSVGLMVDITLEIT